MAVADLVEVLRTEREDIVPLIGAGLCVEAGLPGGAELAETLRERSGLEPEAPAGDFGAVCREIERLADLRTLQDLAAEAIASAELTPTPSLMAISGCPSACVLTTNYDRAIERSVEQIGQEPVRISMAEDLVGRRPQEGQVFVIHLHGVTERPETMVLTTTQRRALLDDENFRTRLRSLLLDGRLLALGLRLSAEEPHLRAELGRLGRLLGGPRPLVVLPDSEVDKEIRILADDAAIDLYRCDPAQDYLEVRQCAQLLAPRQIDATEVITEMAAGVSVPFLDPPLLGPRQLTESNTDPSIAVQMAESGFGSTAGVGEMAESRRALLVGAPGRGKTMALRRLGEEERGRTVRCDLRNFRPVPEAPERGFARLVARDGEAFDRTTPVPSRDALREGTFVFLLDGMEEAEFTEQAAIVEAIVAAGESWPQHSYVVATRPTTEARRLRDAGFDEFLVEGSEGWGNRYLRACGITPEQIEHLYEVVPTIRAQLAIPRYAARIAAELHEETEGVELSRGALERLVRGERKNLEEAARRLGVGLDELVGWASRLAMMIELRGETSATTEEIATLSGPASRDSGTTCEELIAAALLQDLPDRARFSAQISQEALCAEAILRSADPLGVFQAVAVAEVDGRQVLRDDIEHTLDLVFEGADAPLRESLRELDELRWARTQGAGDPATVAEAIDVIRRWHRDRRLWIRHRGDNQLRGPGEALKALHQMEPSVLESCRAELYEECRSEERTIRGNAIELLTLLAADDQNEPVLRGLIADPDDVVRRHAAHAIEDFGLAGLNEELRAAWEGEHDELALEAIGLALGTLADEDELRETIPLLHRKPKGWQRINYRILERVSLPSLADLLGSGSLGPDDAKELLDKRFERDEPFSAVEAGALGRVLLGGDWRLGQKYQAQIAAVAAEHPHEILDGASAAAGEETGFLELLWASDIDRDLLASHAEGPLAEPIERLLERVAWREEADLGDFSPPEPPIKERRSEDDLATLVARGEIGEDKVPSDQWLSKLPREPEEVKERLLAFAEAWYPDDPGIAVRREGARTIVTNGFRGAIGVWAALDHPIAPERWLQILGTGMAYSAGSISDWMSLQWEDGWSEAAAERIRDFDDPRDVALAAEAIPRWNGELCDLFAEKARRLEDDSLSFSVIGRLRDLADLDRLRAIAAGEREGSIRERALDALAHLGDVAAQRQLLEELLGRAEGEPGTLRHHEPGWLSSISSPDLVDLLGEILRATHHCEDASIFRRIVEAGIRNIGDESCLRLYNRLIADPHLEGGQFYWYQREALARSLARQAVMARLSETDPLEPASQNPPSG